MSFYPQLLQVDSTRCSLVGLRWATNWETTGSLTSTWRLEWFRGKIPSGNSNMNPDIETVIPSAPNLYTQIDITPNLNFVAIVYPVSETFAFSPDLISASVKSCSPRSRRHRLQTFRRGCSTSRLTGRLVLYRPSTRHQSTCKHEAKAP